MKVWEAYKRAFQSAGEFRYGKVTGTPSTTVITDSNLSLVTNKQANAMLMILKTTDAAAPQGEFHRIASNTSGAITVDTALSAQTTAGDLYAYTTKQFHPFSLYEIINEALEMLEAAGFKDTSITTASNQREYTLPLAIRNGWIRGVYLQTRTNDSNKNEWVPIYDWSVEPGTPGAAGIIVLPQLVPSRTIKIEYLGLHTEVTAFDDEIDNSIRPGLIKAALKLAFANIRTDTSLQTQKNFRQGYNKAKDEFEEALRKYPLWRPEKRGNPLIIFPLDDFDPGEPNKVRV